MLPMLMASDQERKSSNLATQPLYQSSKGCESDLKTSFQYGKIKSSLPPRPPKSQSICEENSYFATIVTKLSDSFNTASRSHTNQTLSGNIRSKEMLHITRNFPSRTEKRIQHYENQCWRQADHLAKGHPVAIAIPHPTAIIESPVTHA